MVLALDEPTAQSYGAPERTPCQTVAAAAEPDAPRPEVLEVRALAEKPMRVDGPLRPGAIADDRREFAAVETERVRAAVALGRGQARRAVVLERVGGEPRLSIWRHGRRPVQRRSHRRSHALTGLAAHLIGKAGLSKKDAPTGAVTLIQGFEARSTSTCTSTCSSSMASTSSVRTRRCAYRRIGVLTSADLDALMVTLAHRVGRLLERRGILERDAENVSLAGDADVEATALERRIIA